MDPRRRNPWCGNPHFEPPGGHTTELLKFAAGATVLTLFWGNRSEEVIAPFVSGTLTLAFVGNRVIGSAIAMVFCHIGGHYWPLGKDCIAIRVGPRRFCFCLPSLLLGVTLPAGCTDEQLQRLEHILRGSCTYENLSGNEDSHFCNQEPGRDFWGCAYPNVARAMNAIAGGAGAPLPRRIMGPVSDVERRRRRDQMEYWAFFFSSMTATVSRIIVNGLVGAEHVLIVGRPTATWPAIASIRVVSDLVEMEDRRLHAAVGTPLVGANRRLPPETTPFWVWRDCTETGQGHN